MMPEPVDTFTGEPLTIYRVTIEYSHCCREFSCLFFVRAWSRAEAEKIGRACFNVRYVDECDIQGITVNFERTLTAEELEERDLCDEPGNV